LIVIFVDDIENFANFLDKRMQNEIYYEIKDVKDRVHLSSKHEVEIFLHFLAKINETIVLYETKISVATVSNTSVEKEVINELQNIFAKVDSTISLIKGKIREIFLSR
jgi:hypothetical protein